MNSKEYWGLMEAYSEVYAPQEIDEASVRGGRVTGSNPNVFKPTPTTSRPAGGGMYGMRGTGRNRNSTQTSSSPGALRGTSTAAKPAPTPAAKPAPTPAAKPAPTPAAKPAPTPAAKPAAKPAPTTSTTSAAPKRTFNPLMQKTFGYQTGYAPDQVKKDPKKMAQMGSLKSISSGLDMFDLVKGHLLDEGYADTEEAAIAIMANMSEEWRESILDEASRADDTTRANIDRYAGKKGISFEPGPNWDPSANRGRGAHLNPKQKEKQRRKALRQADK